MQDWAVRTENPYEANLFYLPLFNAHNGGNVGWSEGSAGGLHDRCVPCCCEPAHRNGM
jgi:hypothetical protein